MKDPATCTHRKDNSHYVTHTDWDGEEVSEWVEDTISTEEDFGLHRTKCSQCGHIGYYSSAARDYFEKGIKSPIRGLDGKS